MLSAALLIMQLPSAAAGETVSDFVPDIKDYDASSYASYLNAYSDAERSPSAVELSAESARFCVGNAEYRSDFEGNSGSSAYTDENSSIEWSVNIGQSGMYIMQWEYYPVSGNGGAVERRLLIDGSLPFSEAGSLSFCRPWKNAEGEIKLDTQGNQVMIEQVEAPQWMSQYAVDPSGTADGPLQFYLSAGIHKITVESVTEPMLLKKISLLPADSFAVTQYDDAVAEYKDSKDNKNEKIVIEGENADIKSDMMFYPVSDKTSPSVSPYSYSKIVYNSIGGSQWSNAGQWLEWKFKVEKSGTYSLSAHFKQSTKEYRASVRTVYIDGRIPFAEAENWMFPYSSVWQTEAFSNKNGDPYLFYLDEGWHTLRLEVSLGDYRSVISQSRELLNRLNSVYRSIIVVSGANPDQYRDYKFDETIPETLKDMDLIRGELRKLEKTVQKTDGSDKTVSDIKKLYDQLDMMLDDTDTISARLTGFKDNIAAFGTWINTQQGQPLQIDWIELSGANVKLPRGEAGIFSRLLHYFRTFMCSFTTDYKTIGQTESLSDEAVTVWIKTSRDQANILRQLTVGDFTPSENIPVSVQLVSANALLPAILAHKGPDVALGIAQSDVNNLAIRNAIYDLSEFPDCNEPLEEFYKYSVAPFEWNGGLYGLPETAVWPMLFYRSDILKELDISLGDLSTWDSLLHSVLPKLQKNSLDFGMLPTVQNYLNMLYQSQGSMYINDGKNSGLSSAAAIESMKVFAMLYEQYGLSLSFDFANRFRTGEMPVAVVDYTMYNTLTMFAAEIKGLWGMLPIPGTVSEDGTVDRTAAATLTGTVMLSDTKNPQAAWKFMKWWASAETQNSFGKRLESVVGSAARYNTANKAAMERVGWDPDMRAAMLYQANACSECPEVPGGYFTARLFGFAFRSIIYDDEDVREAMDGVTEDIDREMANKRREYGLE